MKRIFILIMLSIFAIGCVTTFSEKGLQSQYWNNAILAGYSTEQNIIDILGPPDKKENKPDGTYRFVYKLQRPTSSNDNNPADTIIEFDKAGVVYSIILP
jgi:hypothetical protein